MENYAVGYVVNKKDRVALLVKHVVSSRIKYLGLGVEVLQGQTPVEALMKAFAEESGLHLEEWKHFATSDNGKEITHYFTTDVSQDRIRTLAYIGDKFILTNVDFALNGTGQTTRWLLPLIFDPFVADVVRFRINPRLEVQS